VFRMWFGRTGGFEELGFESPGLEGPCEQEALDLVDAFPAEVIELVDGLDAFGEGF